jgi:Uma2 family endonuclease
MGSPAKIFPHYTYREWEQWDGQWELIEGIPFAMSPMPVPKHQRIAAGISSEFRMQMKQCKNCSVYLPIDYRITEDTILEPDMLIVCGEITKKYLDFPPALVVEILSPSTALKDRHTKFYLYEQQGVKYYLIVDDDQEFIEVYELIDGSYKLIQTGKDFSHHFSFDLCSVTIDFKEIW